MKTKIIDAIFILILLAIIGCSNEEPDIPKEIVSGTFEFSDTGNHDFQIDASDIRATITIIGAGGGGGGGVDHNSGTSSTGGGGGGGAGEFKLIPNESLEGNVTYTVMVGTAGNGGAVGQIGSNGQASEIILGNTNLYIAASGTGGLSNTINSLIRGDGGNGFPEGRNGTNGERRDIFSLRASPGLGGLGGENTSQFGFGGNGGIGTEIDFLTVISPENGTDGGNGYVKIEWTGLR